MNKRKISVALTGGALTVAAVFATTAAAQATPAPRAAATTTAATAAAHQPKPTIVLVAGAFEDSTAWSGEITMLENAGYPVIAPAVPLRGVASDSAYLTALVRSIHGPVVLVGHSYGGFLITEVAASDPGQVKALVYSAAFIPKAGQTANQLVTSYPGSLLGPDTTYSVTIPGGTDTYVKPADFRALFAADRTPAEAAVDAATQRPVESAALNEPAAADVPHGIPVYAIVAAHDMAIPPAAERFEAQQAHAVITTVDSSHDLPTSHPAAVTAVIERAAR
ncbi:MAG TPA: alpha/beta hydrolase [Streptosporangiaceae bacterium]|jgi:pimeloyl-ACP methyl ester carboxylesterase